MKRFNSNQKRKLSILNFQLSIKKVSLFFVAMCMTLSATVAQVSVWDGTNTIWTNGAGTENSPYLIESAQHLAYLAVYANNGEPSADKHWKLTTNIDLSFLQWTPIGDPNNSFSGHFNGNEKTIANLYINSTTINFVGLFGCLSGGSVKNIGIIGTSSITANSGMGSYVGGIVGYARASFGSATFTLTIDHCYNTGNISASSSGTSYVGGIVGYIQADVGTNGTINVNNCYNTGNISSTFTGTSYNNFYAAGIVGYAVGSTLVVNINNCYNTGNVSSSATSSGSAYAGGIFAYNSINATIKINNSYNRGTISGTSGNSDSRRSGIHGSGNGVITNCYNTGTATNAIRGTTGTTVNCYYLAGSGSGTYGGESKTEQFMKTQDFVDLLNSGPAPNNAYALDANMVNAGYPIFLWQVPPPVPPIITTTSLPGGVIGTAYNQQLSATGDTPITWTLEGGSLPNNVTLSTSGLISGTPNTAGTFNFTVKATNSAGNDTKALSITITSSATAPVITTTTLPNGTTGTTYNAQLEATGTAPIAWSLQSGSLPTGVTLSAAGVISGTPSVAGSSNFTVKAENSAGSDSKALSITITSSATAPVITTTTLPGGLINTPYSETLAATGAAPITWGLASGNLPTGLTLYSGGTISGTPTAEGTFSFTVQATNSVGSDTKALFITITATAVAPTIITTTLPNGKTGTAYSAQLEATGTAPISWSLQSGNLPTGLTLYGTGTISGTPTATGTFNFTVQAMNSVGSDTKALNITIENGGVGIVETDNEPSLRIYPNPVNGELHIGYAICDNAICDIEIYDLMGRRVATVETLRATSLQTTSTTTIDVSHLPAGMYFIKIGEKTVKFVKE